MNKARFAVSLCSLVLIIAVSMLLSRASEPQPVTPAIGIKTFTLSAQTPTQVLHVAGTTRSSNTAILRFQVAGRVTEKATKLGDAVDQGAVLASIYNPEIEPLVQQANDNVARLTAATEQAQRDFERLDSLLNEQAVTRQEWEVGRTRYTTANNAEAAAKAELARAEQVAKELQLIAPFAGSITEIMVDVGDVVAVGAPAMRLSNLSSVELRLAVSDTVLQQLRLGQSIAVYKTLANNASSMTGVVSEISPFRERGSLPELVLELDAKQVAPGTAVRAEIVVRADNTLSLPLKSVLMTGEQTTAVYKIVDGIAQLTPIRPLSIHDDKVLINQGLVVGDEIALEGIAKLFDGAKVQVLVNARAKP